MQLRLRGFLIVLETVKEMQLTEYTSWTLVLVAGERQTRRAATDVMRLQRQKFNCSFIILDNFNSR